MVAGETEKKVKNKKIKFYWDEPKRKDKSTKLKNYPHFRRTTTRVKDIDKFVEKTLMMQHGPGSSVLKIANSWVTADLTGYASVEGTKSYNKKLAKRRIEIVEQHIKGIAYKGKHLKVLKKTVVGEGDRVPDDVKLKKADIKPDERRVDLELNVNNFFYGIVSHRKGTVLLKINSQETLFACARA
ncbi:MAG: hypothetical protein GY754_05530 [bacterium]|nr:hypothetical protein [bacterium]